VVLPSSLTFPQAAAHRTSVNRCPVQAVGSWLYLRWVNFALDSRMVYIQCAECFKCLWHTKHALFLQCTNYWNINTASFHKLRFCLFPSPNHQRPSKYLFSYRKRKRTTSPQPRKSLLRHVNTSAIILTFLSFLRTVIVASVMQANIKPWFVYKFY